MGPSLSEDSTGIKWRRLDDRPGGPVDCDPGYARDSVGVIVPDLILREALETIIYLYELVGVKNNSLRLHGAEVGSKA